MRAEMCWRIVGASRRKSAQGKGGAPTAPTGPLKGTMLAQVVGAALTHLSGRRIGAPQPGEI